MDYARGHRVGSSVLSAIHSVVPGGGYFSITRFAWTTAQPQRPLTYPLSNADGCEGARRDGGVFLRSGAGDHRRVQCGTASYLWVFFHRQPRLRHRPTARHCWFITTSSSSSLSALRLPVHRVGPTTTALRSPVHLSLVVHGIAFARLLCYSRRSRLTLSLRYYVRTDNMSNEVKVRATDFLSSSSAPLDAQLLATYPTDTEDGRARSVRDRSVSSVLVVDNETGRPVIRQFFAVSSITPHGGGPPTLVGNAHQRQLAPFAVSGPIFVSVPLVKPKASCSPEDLKQGIAFSLGDIPVDAYAADDAGFIAIRAFTDPVVTFAPCSLLMGYDNKTSYDFRPVSPETQAALSMTGATRLANWLDSMHRFCDNNGAVGRASQVVYESLKAAGRIPSTLTVPVESRSDPSVLIQQLPPESSDSKQVEAIFGAVPISQLAPPAAAPGPAVQMQTVHLYNAADEQENKMLSDAALTDQGVYISLEWDPVTDDFKPGGKFLDLTPGWQQVRAGKGKAAQQALAVNLFDEVIDSINEEW